MNNKSKKFLRYVEILLAKAIARTLPFIGPLCLGSGEIEFEEFAAMVANFVNEDEDKEALVEELREAFRLYDKEVCCSTIAIYILLH